LTKRSLGYPLKCNGAPARRCGPSCVS
jgi:hypothetical protein